MMTFAWDENKAAANLRMHGVAFKEALEVFDDSEARWSFQTMITPSGSADF